MLPNFCGAIGFAGWLAMLLLWGGLIAVVVWGIARLFPQRSLTSPLSGSGDRSPAPVDRSRPSDEPADREPPFAEPAPR